MTFASSLCVSLESNISLLVATLDLAVVKSIRDAIRTADLSSGKQFPVTAIGPAPNPLNGCGGAGDCYEHRRHIMPEPVYEPRRHYTPAPEFLPRPVIHPVPRVEPGCVPCPPVPHGCEPMKKCPIEPPWASVPWKNPTPAPDKIKVVVKVHDKDRRGQIIDLFI